MTRVSLRHAVFFAGVLIFWNGEVNVQLTLAMLALIVYFFLSSQFAPYMDPTDDFLVRRVLACHSSCVGPSHPLARSLLRPLTVCSPILALATCAPVCLSAPPHAPIRMFIYSFIRPSIRPVEYLPHEHLPQRVLQPAQRYQGPSRCGEDGHLSVTSVSCGKQGALGGSHCVVARCCRLLLLLQCWLVCSGCCCW